MFRCEELPTECLEDPPPCSERLVVLEASCAPKVQDVSSFSGYAGCNTDALRPPEPEESTFGGIAPANVNYRHLFDGMRMFGFPNLEELAVRFESRGGRVPLYSACWRGHCPSLGG